MLTENQIKEQLSYAFVHAVASRVGITCGPAHGPDMDSVDVNLGAIGKLENDSVLNSPRLDLQLKATAGILGNGDEFSFPLPIKNYNDLRLPRHTPCLLVVFEMPENPEYWLSQSPDALITRHCGYWCSLRNMPPVENATIKTIRVKRSRILTPESLRELMVRISRCEELSHEE